MNFAFIEVFVLLVRIAFVDLLNIYAVNQVTSVLKKKRRERERERERESKGKMAQIYVLKVLFHEHFVFIIAQVTFFSGPITSKITSGIKLCRVWNEQINTHATKFS